jgi:hypothetical protein
MDIATFRADFSEFDQAAYPDADVTFWLTLAGKLLNVERWADLLDVGTELFIAHQLVLEKQAKKTSAVGGVPGMGVGVLTAKAVKDVSAGYDATAAIELDAGHWNSTTFGLRFINLARMVGSGGMQF